MKKTLLMSVIMGLSMNAFSQFAFTTTKATYTGNGQTPNSTSGAFYSYQPGYDPCCTYYVDNNCSTAPGGTGANELGGFDPNFQDATTVTPARSSGAILYGGKIRTVYTGSPCSGASPSFGFDFNYSDGTATSTVVDMTLAGNQKFAFTYQNDAGTDFPVAIQLYDRSYTGKLTNYPYTLLADGASHTVNLDLSTYISPGADMSNIFQVSFVYVSDTKSPNFGVSLANITLGGNAVATSTQKASALVASSKIYPNPSSDQMNLDLNLVSQSDVKVTLSDMMGREVMTIAQGSMQSVSQTFSVANLQKGMYTANYYVNGAAAKAELVMVK